MTISVRRRDPALPRAPWKLLAAFALAGSLFLGCFAPRAHAANGDVLSVSNVLRGKDISAITLDTSNNPPGGSFWVLGKSTGKIYHVSLDLGTVLGEIPNPHGAGSFPNIILSFGIAYRPLTKTLFVLAQSAGVWKVREVKTADGLEVTAGAFDITVPDGLVGDLRGLTYDTIARELWYLDVYNDRIIRTGTNGLATKVCSLPGDTPPETTIRGEGICFDLTEVATAVFEQRLYVSYGDIFHQQPTRIIQLKDSCEDTGVEIPLTKLDSLDAIPLGFQMYRVGVQRRVAVVLSDGRLAQLEQALPTTVPPSQLRTSVTLTNQVALGWLNHGKGSAGEYGGEVVVLRNGVPFKTLPGNVTNYVDTTPLEGTSVYSLRASETPGGALSSESTASEITVGTGGIVRWVPFAGNKPYDVARNPANGEIYVTDDLGLEAQGRIYHYDSKLNPLPEVPSPWARPGAIAFIPTITIDGNVIENALAVGRTDGALVKLIDLSGNEKTTFVLEGCTRLGSLTYIPSSQEFVCVDADTATISTADNTGRVRRQCRPHENVFQNLPEVDNGVTYDPIQQTFLSVFKDGIVRELFPAGTCLPTIPGFEISLASLGEGWNEPEFAGGVQIAGNTLIICGRQSRAIFQVLIFPAGPAFRRGDFDRNDDVNLSDAVAVARYLFQAGVAPTCQDSADMNDDGVLDISDPVYLLFHLFLQGSPPPAPFPGAGSDPTFRDNLGCEEA